MDKSICGLTVFFEAPFWVGVFECAADGTVSACKVTFGAEPKSYEIGEYVRKNYYHLVFSPAVTAPVSKTVRNPKRLQRCLRKQMQQTGVGTKSQQALKLQQEQCKLARKAKKKAWKTTEQAHKFALKQQKKKEKHKGR